MCSSGHLADLPYDTTGIVEKHFQAAVMDCNFAIDMEPMNVKAHYRKAVALEHLGQVDDALKSAHTARSHACAAMQASCDALLDRLQSEVHASKLDDMD